MKLRRLSFINVASLIAIFSLTSCISTDTIEPEICPAETPVFLNLVAPSDAPTRADDGYKLRYTAKLYSGTDRQSNTVTVQRQELIEGEEGGAGIKNQMVFYVPQGSPYVIYVFADYIPANFERQSSNGLYKDYFYDTTLDKNVVRMLSTPGNKNTYNVASSFFNNDRYDCFGGVAALEENKTAEKVEFNLTLHRLVSKVRLVDNSKFSGYYDGEIQSITYLSQYTLKKSLSDETGWAPKTSNSKLTIFNNQEFSSGEEKELFFFYTFATTGTVSPECPKLQMNITDHSEKTLATVISTGDIPVKRNQITTVKGKLLPGISDEPEENPSIEEEGPIILNLSSSNEEWAQEESTWQSN